MNDYLKYYLGPAMVATAYVGFALGGYWMWLGFLTFPALAIADSLFERDMSLRKMGHPFWGYVPVVLTVLMCVGMYLVFAWSLNVHQLNWFQMLGGSLSCAWLSAVPLVPAAHEMYHHRNQIIRFLGRNGHICILDTTRDIAHAVGHHIDVATYKDGDTAPRGKDLYSFTGKAIFVSTKESFDKEAESLEKRGYSKWNWRHRMYQAVAVQIAFQAIVYAIGGWVAVGMVLLGMLIARAWVESFNYFQHYGVCRVPGAPIERHHLWNHLGPLSRLAAFEITNHADHHINSFQPFWELRPHKEAVPMPNVAACFLIALIPPLWQEKVAKPALKRWDEEWASEGELQIAKQMNLEAGWPDWFDNNVQASAPQELQAAPA